MKKKLQPVNEQDAKAWRDLTTPEVWDATQQVRNDPDWLLIMRHQQKHSKEILFVDTIRIEARNSTILSSQPGSVAIAAKTFFSNGKVVGLFGNIVSSYPMLGGIFFSSSADVVPDVPLCLEVSLSKKTLIKGILNYKNLPNQELLLELSANMPVFLDMVCAASNKPLLTDKEIEKTTDILVQVINSRDRNQPSPSAEELKNKINHKLKDIRHDA